MTWQRPHNPLNPPKHVGLRQACVYMSPAPPVSSGWRQVFHQLAGQLSGAARQLDPPLSPAWVLIRGPSAEQSKPTHGRPSHRQDSQPGPLPQDPTQPLGCTLRLPACGYCVGGAGRGRRWCPRDQSILFCKLELYRPGNFQFANFFFPSKGHFMHSEL